MSLRHSVGRLAKRATTSTLAAPGLAAPTARTWQTRQFATPVPPVTQNAAGSKGPTAMVFLNMGGPSTTDEVEDFLSRLFVCREPSSR